MKRIGEPPYICLITEGKANTDNFDQERSRIVRTACDAVSDGVTLVQIREKTLPARLLFDLVKEVRFNIPRSKALLLVNDRTDIVVAAGADGVHLPEHSLRASTVRRSFGPDLIVGVSTHSLDAARLAVLDGADYVFFGPVFETPGKGGPVGAAELARVSRELKDLSVIALGGIDENNFSEVLASGAAGIAAIRSLNQVTSRRAIVTGIAAGERSVG